MGSPKGIEQFVDSDSSAAKPVAAWPGGPREPFSTLPTPDPYSADPYKLAAAASTAMASHQLSRRPPPSVPKAWMRTARDGARSKRMAAAAAAGLKSPSEEPSFRLAPPAARPDTLADKRMPTRKKLGATQATGFYSPLQSGDDRNYKLQH
eukprot:CAMPEP_0172599788 /NCGR_PEP_ID=MMETSP1068-20121228/19908_1 /TAXON_ID=35684 /ORGANISM="Pseudopedinella elastica, Strain CCMP716" /LENGTH=150 /DNA_ID=CAMNT_0013400155 /DNA_START=56 /DNA_END=508 /DNA_ORIENTATION=+